MKIGFLSESTSNAYYRAIIPMRAVERRGHTVVWPETLGEDAPLRALAECDVVHCYRRPERFDDLRRLSERGVALTFDNDDNYAAASVGERGDGLQGWRFNQAVSRALLKCATLADLTTTPSGALAEIYRSSGAPEVRVVENALERTMPGFGTRERHDGVVVGWIAGSEHRVDLEGLQLSAALGRMLDAHGDARVLSVGLKLPLRPDRYEHVPEVPFPRLLEAIGRIDIGIAPLLDTAFNGSRSNVKLKEYAACGVPWLASPVGPYRELGEREGGLLVDDDEWDLALERLVCDARLRKQLAKRALKWGKRVTIETCAAAWERAFEEALERAHVARRRGVA
jgi:glycosyltransferase involved in cell wall biosynthesis